MTGLAGLVATGGDELTLAATGTGVGDASVGDAGVAAGGGDLTEDSDMKCDNKQFAVVTIVIIATIDIIATSATDNNSLLLRIELLEHNDQLLVHGPQTSTALGRCCEFGACSLSIEQKHTHAGGFEKWACGEARYT
jgi:hypothetical protein